MTTTLILFALGAGVVTFLGGLFSMRFRDKSHLTTSFSAGVVLGLAFFDLLPESIEMFNGDLQIVTTLIAVGFIFYLVLDRLFTSSSKVKEMCDDTHGHTHENHIGHNHRGELRASSLIFHSFLDGVGIGFAFQVSSSLGILVAIAVLAHDFSDGINTVSAISDKTNKYSSKTMKFLIMDSVAPILGIISTLFFTVTQNVLGLILAIFCGFFFYMSASDLIPESYHSHPTKLTTFMTILGMVFIYVVIQLAH